MDSDIHPVIASRVIVDILLALVAMSMYGQSFRNGSFDQMSITIQTEHPVADTSQWDGTNAFSQHGSMADETIQGKGNLRLVHDLLLANMIRGNYVITPSSFSFYPSTPNWLLDSICLDVSQIDTVTAGFRSLLIHPKGAAGKVLRVQCRHPKKVVGSWLAMWEQHYRRSAPIARNRSASMGYEVQVLGFTFGSTLYTPIAYRAVIDFDPQMFRLRPIAPPLSFLYVSYNREQIKRVKLKEDRIRVSLHDGGCFTIRTLDNAAVRKEMSEWYGSP